MKKSDPPKERLKFPCGCEFDLWIAKLSGNRSRLTIQSLNDTLWSICRGCTFKSLEIAVGCQLERVYSKALLIEKLPPVSRKPRKPKNPK